MRSMAHNRTHGMNLIPMPADQKPVLKPPASRPPDEIEKPDQTTDADYLEIFYCKGRMRDAVPFDPSKLAPADLGTALAETMSLVPAGDAEKNNAYAWIVFYNQKNFNSLHILRTGDDLWNLDTPAYCDDPACRFKHIAQSDTKRLEDIIKMFFEGGDWYGMAPFSFDYQSFEAGV